MDHDVIVTLTADGERDFPAAVSRLQQAGLQIRDTMPAFGIVSGTAPDTVMSTLRRHPVVESLEEDQPVRAF